MLQAAIQAFQNGQFDESERHYRSIAFKSPEFADAVLGLAVLAHQRGRFLEAAGHFSRLVALSPGVASNHSNLGECLREAGRLEEATTQLKLGISLDADQPDAYNSLGLVYHAQRKGDEAEATLRQALQLRPDYPMAMINLGMVLQEKKQEKEAADWFRQALTLDPENPMGLSNLGQILVEIGEHDDLDEAEMLCKKAIQLTPGRPHPINNLGNVYRSMGRFEEALECYNKAMAIAPSMAMPINNMGQALHGRARYDEAIEFYLNALALEPNSARFHANLASLYKDEDQFDEALERFQHALVIDPEHIESLCGMGRVYIQLMKTAEAEECFRKALEIDPESMAPRMGLAGLYSELGEFDRAEQEYALVLQTQPKAIEIYYQRATHHKGKVSDADLNMMQTLLKQKYLGEGGRSQLNFALGAVHDKRKNYEAAAQNFRVANENQTAARLKRSETYDPELFTSYIHNVIEAFTPEFIAKFQGQGDPSHRPIFVVGLPRSGTTLTEQILASHPAVHGAGELAEINTSFQDLPVTLGLNQLDSFQALKQLNVPELRASAEAYLRELQKLDANAPFVVDKMPDNVNLLGWIHLLFPNARIIHCQRDLRDIALSCWQTSFGAIRWANDWSHIAGRFINSLRVVNHWKTIPGLEVLEFPYESVIADPEKQARTLIAYAGLDWHPNCIKFHETKRQVRTASLSQVREPIYKSSIAKWKNYERELGPLIEALSRAGHRFEDT